MEFLHSENEYNSSMFLTLIQIDAFWKINKKKCNYFTFALGPCIFLCIIWREGTAPALLFLFAPKN